MLQKVNAQRDDRYGKMLTSLKTCSIAWAICMGHAQHTLWTCMFSLRPCSIPTVDMFLPDAPPYPSSFSPLLDTDLEIDLSLKS